jgi:flagellar basal-body rod protein FlgC
MLRAMQVLSQGMAAQRTRLDVASSNLANANTTETASGGPYRRQEVVFRAMTVGQDGQPLQGVEVARVIGDQSPFPMKEMPGLKPGDPPRMVAQPNVNVVDEMVDITTASRSFEANVTAFEALKQMVHKSMELGR